VTVRAASARRSCRRRWRRCDPEEDHCVQRAVRSSLTRWMTWISRGVTEPNRGVGQKSRRPARLRARREWPHRSPATGPGCDQLSADSVWHLEATADLPAVFSDLCDGCLQIRHSKDQGSAGHLPGAGPAAVMACPMSAGLWPPAFRTAQRRRRTLRAQYTRVELDVNRHITAGLVDEAELLEHARSLRRQADRARG
jgi:hypothetical protein